VIQINPHGVFDIRCLANGNGRPRLTYAVDPRMLVNPGDAPFFPAGGNIWAAVAIHVGQPDAVSAARAVVDGVPSPTVLWCARILPCPTGPTELELAKQRANGRQPIALSHGADSFLHLPSLALQTIVDWADLPLHLINDD
jgi:hypothetical protein